MKTIICLVAIVCVFLLASVASEHKPCKLREYPHGYVCVCDETYCDTTDVKMPTQCSEYVIVTSSRTGKLFEVSEGHFKSTQHPSVVRIKRDSDKLTLKLTLDYDKKFQKIVGFGGSFTGSVSYLFNSMPVALRRALYRNYYSQDEGIGYSMMRIPIGGCDFDLEPWAYNEYPTDDKELSNFTQLDRRDLERIEQLNDLKQASGIDDIKLIGSAWSPPKWMKSNNKWSGRSALKQEYFQTWADYHLQYLRLMRAQNWNFWAITTGNEPLNGVIGQFFIHFMSLGWRPSKQGEWIGKNLGPSLKNSEFQDVKLFAGDDQRYTYPWWFERLNRGASNAMNFVSGLAVHWYWDRMISPSNLDKAHDLFPDKILINTESCLGDKPFETHGPVLGDWSRAQLYALGIIQDLEHHVAGWIDWNLILNEQGGPTYIDNTVEAAVVLNSTSNAEFYKQPIFYVLGHFSKFITPGSVRIAATLSGYKSNTVKVVAFLRPDNIITAIFYNNSNKKRLIQYTDELRGSFEIEIELRSIVTLNFI